MIGLDENGVFDSLNSTSSDNKCKAKVINNLLQLTNVYSEILDFIIAYHLVIKEYNKYRL